MEYPFSVLEYCLANSPVTFKAYNVDRTFAYATNSVRAVVTCDDQPTALLVLAETEIDPPTTIPVIIITGEEIDTAFVCALINERLSSLGSWNEEMGSLVERGCTSMDLLAKSEPIISKYIGLSDAMFAHVAHTPHIDPIDDMSRELVSTGNYPARIIKLVERMSVTKNWASQQGTVCDLGGNDINPLPNASRIYRLNGHYAAHLVMVSESEIKPFELFLFDLLADKIGACLNLLWRTREEYFESDGLFIRSIMNDHVHDVALFQERARKCDLPLTGVFEIAAIGGAEERGGIAHVAHQIKIRLRSCRVLIEENRIFVLMITSGKKDGALAAMEEELFNIVERLHAQVGLSSRFDELEGCHSARLESDIALDYGPKNAPKYAALAQSERNLYTVFRFKRYFPCFLVDPMSDTAEFLDSYRRSENVVTKLRRADKEHGTNDFGLLKVYLYFDCSIKTTCETLHMHRNTVIYRLTKIRNEFHIDLDDPDTRLFLHYLFGVMD